MRIVLVGVNHRTAPVSVRERVAFSREQARRAINELRASGVLREGVILSTCNRSELYGVVVSDSDAQSSALRDYFVRFHGVAPADLNGAMYSCRGNHAIQHLYRVASGLDSMLLGESEILGQVRDAYHFALESDLTGPYLNRLFQSALEAGKRVRAETAISVGPMSATFAAMKLAEQIFGRLRGHQALIIGAGTMAEQVVEHLCKRDLSGVLVANRSNDRARELAERFHGRAVDWQELAQVLAKPDILIAAAGGPDTIITRAAIERAMMLRSNRRLFAMDLSVPRTIDAACGELYNVFLYNVDDLSGIVEENKKAREREIPRAEAIVAEQLRKFEQWEAGSQRAMAQAQQSQERLHPKGTS